MAGFTVKGTKIFDPSGQEFIVKGCNCNGYNWGWPRSTVKDIDLIVNTWKFNTIRVVNWLKFRSVPPFDYPSFKNNNDLDLIVKEFTARQVVVMLDAHDLSSGYYTEKSDPSLADVKKWFVDLANKHKNNPYVWFNLMNEPGGSGKVSSEYLRTHGELVKAIRAVCNNVIVIDGNAWAQDLAVWDGNLIKDENSGILNYGDKLKNYDGKKYENIIFSVHIYDQWVQNAEQKLQDYVDRVKNKGLCLIVGEYSYSNNKADTMAASRALFKVIPKATIGRVVWSWDGGAQGCLTKGVSGNKSGGGWNIDKKDGTKPTNLTELGSLVWDDNRRKESLSKDSTSTPTPPPSPTPIPVAPVAPVPTSLPDLVGSDIRVKELLWRKGSTVQFQMTVKNVSKVDIPQVWVSAAFYVDGVYSDWAGQTATLKAGASLILTSQGVVVDKSIFELSAVLDEHDNVKESDEANNRVKITLD